MQLPVIIKSARFLAQLDSSSTHNFVDTDATARAGIMLQGCAGLCVTVANGGRITNPGSCHDLHIYIGNKAFDLDCYDLTLGSFDMVSKPHSLGLQQTHHVPCSRLAPSALERG